MSALPPQTDGGMTGLEKIPYGLHACHFYSGREELLEALVPWFLAGLYNSERCLWMTAPPLPAAEAVRELELAWGGSAKAIADGALRVLDFHDWYGAGPVSENGVIDAWLREEEKALAEGFRGLRIAGNTSFVHAHEWNAFQSYEREAHARFAGRRIVALCSYSAGQCSDAQVVEVMRAHGRTIDVRAPRP